MFQSEATPRFFLSWAWRTGCPISLIPKMIPWACDLKKRICRNAFARRGHRRSRRQNDGQRNPCICGPGRHCPPDGAAVGSCRKNKEERHLRIRSGVAGESCPVFPGAGSEPWPRPISHAGEYAHVRRHRRLGPGPLGTMLMRRMERRRAEREKRAPRTLQEIDYPVDGG